MIAASVAYDAARADNAGPIMHGTLKVNSSSIQTGWYTADLTHRASGIGYIAFCKTQKQWGTKSSSSSLASISVNFPITVSVNYGVIGSVSRSGSLGGGDVAVVGCGNFTSSGFTAYFDALENGDAYVSTSVTWIAVCKS